MVSYDVVYLEFLVFVLADVHLYFLSLLVWCANQCITDDKVNYD